eukprot:gene26887-biopygen5654
MRFDATVRDRQLRFQIDSGGENRHVMVESMLACLLPGSPKESPERGITPEIERGIDSLGLPQLPKTEREKDTIL